MAGASLGESSGDMKYETVIIDHEGQRSNCGYCKSSSDSAISHGLSALSMTVEDYQELIDRGWRRSGKYVYKPNMENTCCPQYTIRLKADEFVASKEQVRVRKKMKRFLDGSQPNQTTNSSNISGIQESLSSSREVNSGMQIDGNKKLQDENITINYLSSKIEEVINACLENGDIPSHVLLPKAIVKKVKAHTKKKMTEISDSDHLLYTSSISFQIAAALRKSLITLTSNENQSEQIVKLSPNEISKILVCSINKIGLPMDIFVQACNGHLNFYSPINVIGESYHLPAKETKHVSHHSYKIEGSSTVPLRIHNLEIRMKQSHFDLEEYELYRKYQIKVHDDEPERVNEESYKRFLVDSPLIFCPPQSGKEGPSCGFGSFHQQYLIDGKVVAVGVMDILPKCLSSKYLFWDPDYASLSLGKYAALKEIDWIKERQSECGSLQYYYLGYYIHSCSKMKYKAGYYPSELLCPLRYRWVPYSIAKPFLDKKSYVVLSDLTTTQNSAEQGELLDDDKSDELDIGQIIVEIRSSYDSRSRLTFMDLQKLVPPSKRKTVEMLGEQIRNYVKVVGMVHELGFPQMPKTHVFNGNKEVTKDQLLDQLCFFLETPRPTVGVVAGPRDGLSAESIRRFLLPATDCQFLLTSVFEELQMDPWYVPSDERPTRCTGTALNVAACLLGACVPGSGARIMAFVGGPSTKGPAPIISKTLSEPFRTHNDLKKDNVPFYDKAVEFYKNLSKQLLHQCHVLDLFACALDQVGVAEMKSAVQRTGGMIVLSESFGHSIFKDSLRRVFQSTDYDIGLSFNGIFEINCSKDIKVQGIIGPCASLERKGRLCSDSVIGEGNTIAWKMCGLDNQTSLCIFFDIATIGDFNEIVRSESNQFYFQFLTYYQHSDGRMRLRSTTISRKWVSGLSYKQDLLPGFDQEAATIVMTRLVSFKMETEPAFDPIRWIDRSLIRLCSWFGDYQKDRPSSFNISPRFSNFPEYMFYLRRSQFVQVSNNSPDETAYFRIVLNRENVSNSILMIQPTLISYSLDLSPKPVPLDVTSIADGKILLLDSYFTIVIFHSTTIAHWRKAGYHKQTEFEAFAALLQAPHNEADRIIKERWSTVPRLVICDQYSSQARFLLAKLNPSVMHGSDNRPPGGEVIITDDVGFQEFMDHLLQRITNV